MYEDGFEEELGALAVGEALKFSREALLARCKEENRLMYMQGARQAARATNCYLDIEEDEVTFTKREPRK